MILSYLAKGLSFRGLMVKKAKAGLRVDGRPKKQGRLRNELPTYRNRWPQPKA